MTSCSDLKSAVIALSIVVALLVLALITYIVVRDWKFFRALLNRTFRNKKSCRDVEGDNNEDPEELQLNGMDLNKVYEDTETTSDVPNEADRGDQMVSSKETIELKNEVNTDARVFNVYIDVSRQRQQSERSSAERDEYKDNDDVNDDPEADYEPTDQRTSDIYVNTDLSEQLAESSHHEMAPSTIAVDKTSVKSRETRKVSDVVIQAIQKDIHTHSEAMKGSVEDSGDGAYSYVPTHMRADPARAGPTEDDVYMPMSGTCEDGEDMYVQPGTRTDAARASQSEDDVYMPMSGTGDDDDDMYVPPEVRTEGARVGSSEDDLYTPMSGSSDDGNDNTVVTTRYSELSEDGEDGLVEEDTYEAMSATYGNISMVGHSVESNGKIVVKF